MKYLLIVPLFVLGVCTTAGAADAQAVYNGQQTEAQKLLLRMDQAQKECQQPNESVRKACTQRIVPFDDREKIARSLTIR